MCSSFRYQCTIFTDSIPPKYGFFSATNGCNYALRIAFYVVLLILANFSFINRLFSILWYQPHTAEPCYAGYAVFFTQLLHPSFGNAPFFAASGAEIYPAPFKRLIYFFPVRRWRDRLESSHVHRCNGSRKNQHRAGRVLEQRRNA